MRSGMGILAVCGIVGAALGVAAEERTDARGPAETGAGQGAQYFSRSGRTSQAPAAGAPGVRNYYKELFGAESSPAPAPVPTGSAEPLDGFDSAPSQTAGVRQAQYTRPAAMRETILPVQGTEQETPLDFDAEAPLKPQPEPPFTVIQPTPVQKAPVEPTPLAPTPATAQPPATFPAQPPAAFPALPSAGLPMVHPATTSLQDTAAAVGLQSPAVSVQWVKKGDINVGQECECELVVKNSGQATATDVTVEAVFPAAVRLVAANPQPTKQAERLSWSLAALEPGAERRIGIRFVATERGEMATSALVRFTGMAAGRFAVEEPMLKLSMQGPEECMLGDPASQIVIVSNPGTGMVQNVTVEATIPPGLEHPRGSRLAMSIGSLAPGETRQVRLGLAAVQGGRHTVQVEAKGSGYLHQTAAHSVDVIAPSVQVVMDGPSLRYVGRNAVYHIAVSNDGAAVSNNVRVIHKVPAGFQFVQADRGGKFDPQTQAIHWFIGRLEPGQSIPVNVELAAAKAGRHVHVVTASTEQSAGTEARCETQVEGAPSLIVEIVDLDDPVEIGAETAYEIRVRNEGSAAASNVALSCELPQGVELMTAQGPASYVADRGLVVFQSLGELAPGKAAIYRVQIRGTQPGNHRFRARLSSDSIDEPLIFEELTKFYGEK